MLETGIIGGLTMELRLKKRGVFAEIRKLIAAVAGTGPDVNRIGERVLTAVGTAVLKDIQDDFAVKAAGGTGKIGGKWLKQGEKYLAYGRSFSRGEQSGLKKAAGVGGRTNRYAPGGNKGLLSGDQLRRWRAIYGYMLRRFLLSLPEKEAKQRASMCAWAKLKREGAATKLKVFGSRTVPIMRDSDDLYNSLSPDGDPEQIFEIDRGTLVIGSRIPYAAAANKRRRFMPESEAEIPDEWKDRWAAAALNEIKQDIAQALGA